jgi:hypothetical protein
MDTLFSKVKSFSGFTCAQLITNGSFMRVYPIESKASASIANALQEFINDVGILETLVCDFASEQTGKKQHRCDANDPAIEYQTATCRERTWDHPKPRTTDLRNQNQVEEFNATQPGPQMALGLWTGIHCRDTIYPCAWS